MTGHYAADQRKVRWLGIGFAFAMMILVAVGILYLGSTAAAAQTAGANETEAGNMTVVVDDPANSTLWTDVEFNSSASLSEDVRVEYWYNGTEIANESVAIESGNKTEVTFNVTSDAADGDVHDVYVYEPENSSAVASISAGVYTDDGSSSGGALLGTADGPVETLLLILGGIAALGVVGAISYGAIKEGFGR